MHNSTKNFPNALFTFYLSEFLFLCTQVHYLHLWKFFVTITLISITILLRLLWLWVPTSNRKKPLLSWSCYKAVYKPVWRIPLLSVQWINSWWWTEELSETCRVWYPIKFVKLVHLSRFIIKKFVTMNGHTNVKFPKKFAKSFLLKLTTWANLSLCYFSSFGI